ncbi:MAG: carbamoyl phosphate synthase small subunit, partial [Candidatus Omnitrophica bacterium]|nr:carbamoyl phosphate synthase small subunit [Candidatus Omnitrophota bacterium]
LVLTYPLIGNYGCAPKFNESKQVWPSGLVIKEKSRIFSNWQAKESFAAFVKRHKLLTLYNVDTRTLAVHLRQKGQMRGIISTECLQAKDLLAKIEKFRKQKSPSLLPKISIDRIEHLGKKKAKKKIAILDLGITNSILRQLETLGLAITLLPFQSKAKEILHQNPDGLIISGGPEEDSGLREVSENIKGLLGRLPILGISGGHQVLAHALGAKINKLKLGHRGVNYPVYNPSSYKGEITVQNHSYVVDADSLSKIKAVKITGYNLNDRSVEEMESKKLKIIGVQYLPISPGFNEVNSILKKFMKIL